MRNFQDTFETRKRSFISAFSISMTVPLKYLQNKAKQTSLPMLHTFKEYAFKHDFCPDNIYSNVISGTTFCDNIKRK